MQEMQHAHILIRCKCKRKKKCVSYVEENSHRKNGIYNWGNKITYT